MISRTNNIGKRLIDIDYVLGVEIILPPVITPSLYSVFNPGTFESVTLKKCYLEVPLCECQH